MYFPAYNARITTSSPAGKDIRPIWIGVPPEEYTVLQDFLREQFQAPEVTFEIYEQVGEVLSVRARGADQEWLRSRLVNRKPQTGVVKLVKASGAPYAAVRVNVVPRMEASMTRKNTGRHLAARQEESLVARKLEVAQILPFAGRSIDELINTQHLEALLDSGERDLALLESEKHTAIITDIGERDYQEDRVIAGVFPRAEPVCRIVGVLDGHGGSAAAERAAEALGEKIGRWLGGLGDSSSDAVASAIENALLDFNEELFAERIVAGSTVCLAVFYGERIFAVNLGDSRLVLVGREGGDVSRVYATRDQKPSAPDERNELDRRGGEISSETGVARVNFLAVARALGDFGISGIPMPAGPVPGRAKSDQPQLHPGSDVIRAVPTIDVLDVRDYNFLFAATDGFWDVVTTAEVVPVLAREVRADVCAEQAMALAMAREVRGRDNTTVVAHAFGDNLNRYLEGIVWLPMPKTTMMSAAGSPPSRRRSF